MYPTQQAQAHGEAACKSACSMHTDCTDSEGIAQHWAAEAAIVELQDNHVGSISILEPC